MALNRHYTNWAKPAAEARAKKAAAKAKSAKASHGASMTTRAKAAHDAAMARRAPPAKAKTPTKTMTNAERFAIRKDESGNRVLNKNYVNSPAGKRAAAATEAKKAAAEAEAKKASAAKTADRRKAVSEYKARGSSMPTPSRRSSFGGGSSQPPRPAPQRSSAAPQTASRGPMAPMDAVRKAQQQPRPGGTSGGPSTRNPGGTGMPSTPRAGVGAPSFRTQSPGTPLSPIVPTPAPKSIGTNPAAWENMPDFSDINMQEGRRPHTPATNFGGQAMRMKKGGEVKKLSRGGGIAKRGTGKGRMC